MFDNSHSGLHSLYSSGKAWLLCKYFNCSRKVMQGSFYLLNSIDFFNLLARFWAHLPVYTRKCLFNVCGDNKFAGKAITDSRQNVWRIVSTDNICSFLSKWICEKSYIMLNSKIYKVICLWTLHVSLLEDEIRGNYLNVFLFLPNGSFSEMGAILCSVLEIFLHNSWDFFGTRRDIENVSFELILIVISVLKNLATCRVFSKHLVPFS